MRRCQIVVICEIIQKLKSGSIDDLLSEAKEKLGLDKQRLFSWIVRDIIPKGASYDFTISDHAYRETYPEEPKPSEHTSPITYCFNIKSENKAIVYFDKKVQDEEKYTLAKVVILDPTEPPPDVLELNDINYYPERHNSSNS